MLFLCILLHNSCQFSFFGYPLVNNLFSNSRLWRPMDNLSIAFSVYLSLFIDMSLIFTFYLFFLGGNLVIFLVFYVSTYMFCVLLSKLLEDLFFGFRTILCCFIFSFNFYMDCFDCIVLGVNVHYFSIVYSFCNLFYSFSIFFFMWFIIKRS